MSASQSLAATLILVAVALGALVVQGVIFWALHRVARLKESVLTLFIARATPPSRFIFPLVGIESALPLVTLPANLKLAAEHVLGIAIIAAITWAIVALILLGGDLAKHPYRDGGLEDLHARQVQTRVDLLARAAITIVIFIGVAFALTTFPAIRAIGATLLASAGLIGIMAGFAARPIFENLVAGIQIALTQPIRIDDVLFLDGDHGHVEKIGSTYVVVKMWDLRRKIYPLTYFINTPFQNWTYSAPNLVGSVIVYVDRLYDMDALRAKAREIVSSSPLWDATVFDLAVTDAKDNFAIELRILCSANNAADLFDLRSFVRERLLAHIAVLKSS